MYGMQRALERRLERLFGRRWRDGGWPWDRRRERGAVVFRIRIHAAQQMLSCWRVRRVRTQFVKLCLSCRVCLRVPREFVVKEWVYCFMRHAGSVQAHEVGGERRRRHDVLVVVQHRAAPYESGTLRPERAGNKAMLGGALEACGPQRVCIECRKFASS